MGEKVIYGILYFTTISLSVYTYMVAFGQHTDWNHSECCLRSVHGAAEKMAFISFFELICAFLLVYNAQQRRSDVHVFPRGESYSD